MSEPNEQQTEQDLSLGAEAALAVARGCLALDGVSVVLAKPYRVTMLGAMVEKANRRAAKLGTEPVRFTVLGDTITGYHELGGGLKRPIIHTVLAVFGTAPRVAGHSLVARIEHTKVGNLISRCPVGAEDIDLTPYRSIKPLCHHCNTIRGRKDTFVLREEASGKFLQVGRNCLTDFLRSEDVSEALALWKLLEEFSSAGGEDEEGGFGGSGYCEPSTLAFVAAAVRSISIQGFWKSNSEHPTAAAASFACGRRPEGRSAADWDEAQPTEADLNRARTVIAWAVASTDPSDYLYNLRIACSCPAVGRHEGLLASAPAAYARHVEKLVAKTAVAKTTRPKGQYLGEVGVRSVLGDLKVVRTRTLDGDYGVRTLVVASAPDGSTVTWFASGARDLEAGTVLQACKATVKKHEDYKGFPQTVVSRMVWTSQEERKNEP